MITRAMFTELCQACDEGFAHGFVLADADAAQRFVALLVWSDWLEELGQELAAVGAYRMAHGKRWPNKTPSLFSEPRYFTGKWHPPKLPDVVLYGWSELKASRNKPIASHELQHDLCNMLHAIGCSQSSDLYTTLLAGALVHGEYHQTREAKRAVRLREMRKAING